MRRILGLIVSVAINASTLPVAATELSNKDIDLNRATVQSQQANAIDKEKSCRDRAASFYQSVMLRQVASERVDGARVLIALDSVINAFNDLLATKCGG
jgi:hypothetical protein